MQAALLAAKPQQESPAAFQWLEKHASIKLKRWEWRNDVRKTEESGRTYMLLELRKLAHSNDKEVKIFHFAGHGSRLTSHVAMPQTVKRQLSEMLLVAPLEDLQHRSSRVQLSELLRLTDAALPVFFLNACSSVAFPTEAMRALSHCTYLTRKEPFISSKTSILRRLINARQLNAEKELIADAAVEGDWLVVWSCEPRRYEVPLADLPEVASLSASARRKLKVEAGGSYINWPENDVDVGMELIRELSDPDIQRANEEKRRKEARQFASGIAVFRRERGLSQQTIEELTGISERTLRRLEEGVTVPHSSTLQKLAAAHGLDLNSYLRELATRRPPASLRPSRRH